MTTWRKTRAPSVVCLSAAALFAGCAAPSANRSAVPRRALALRPPVVRDVASLLSPSRPPARRLPAPLAPGRIRLTSHDDLPGTLSTDVPAANDPLNDRDGSGFPDSHSQHAADPVQDAAGPAIDSDRTAASPLPIDLETVLQLTNGQNPQVAFARARIHEAFAQLDRAQVLWLPSLRAGLTYDKHEGSAQQVQGDVINASRSALFTGFGGVLPGAATPAIPGLFANFQITDAIFQPRIAERTAASRQSAATAARNDALLDSALAYLELLRAAQDLAIAHEARDNVQRLADLTRDYSQTGKGTQADHERARAELALRQNDIERGSEAVKVASARLAQQLSLDPLLAFEPREPIIVAIELVSTETSAAELVARGLTNRPEVAESRHLIGEAVERLQREKMAPLLPSVLLGIGYGGFGGGTGGNITHFNNSFDSVAGAFWEVRNLGLGERAIRCEAESRVEQAQLREVAALDRVAREVVEAHAQVQSRRGQIATAQEGIQAATASYDRNIDRIRNVQGLPIEVLQSIQALTQSRREYLRAIVAYNEAQFRLQRALGWPAEGL